MKVISNKEYEIIKLKQDNNKLYIQELEKRIEEISGANKGYKLENKRLRKRIDKAIEVLKLCNSKCAKETIDILRGEENDNTNI